MSNNAGANITHCGTVAYVDGIYQAVTGTGNWSVAPIIPTSVPVGQVQITFNTAITGPYSVLLTARRTADAPLLTANWGDQTPDGFVVVLYNPVGTRTYTTVRNGDFSFAVLE
ncbi:hypothetical protein [Paraburkholderia fungorum]|uniref:hypothetical protein n=1 Tax=Paraburkholderia fungorum TaxID=134537 RepID=UPI0038BB1166